MEIAPGFQLPDRLPKRSGIRNIDRNLSLPRAFNHVPRHKWANPSTKTINVFMNRSHRAGKDWFNIKRCALVPINSDARTQEIAFAQPSSSTLQRTIRELLTSQSRQNDN